MASVLFQRVCRPSPLMLPRRLSPGFSYRWTFIALFVCVTGVGAVGWLSVAHISSVAPFGAENCRSIKGLNKRQVRLCRQNADLMGSMKMGALMSIMECQYQFRSRRWNCSVVDRSVLFGRIMDMGTREAAFVHAVTSAGATFMITRDCSSGKLEKCGCDRSYNGFNREGFHWAGCSDNIRYGATFTRQFVDAHERRKHKSLELVQMNLHNNEAGRKIIERHMKTQCKCHGVSGSCELKTCWRAMPSFREVGQMLKAKFDGATEVKLGQVNYRPGLIPAHSQFKPHTAEDLVYLHESPDYCVANNKTGSLGTVGRVCNKTSKAIDGCELLCCGRGYVTRYERLVERCHCKFHWCCFVKCKEVLLQWSKRKSGYPARRFEKFAPVSAWAGQNIARYIYCIFKAMPQCRTNCERFSSSVGNRQKLPFAKEATLRHTSASVLVYSGFAGRSLVGYSKKSPLGVQRSLFILINARWAQQLDTQLWHKSPVVLAAVLMVDQTDLSKDDAPALVS
uniref:Protein Wnt n=1 Tax=Trichuris muris TaxID=70415 RepID=A0A5S6Q789_TRIMR